jgi:pimeloyl-ACP methyl ester carboxylesterase
MEHAKFIIAEGSSHVVQLDRPDLIIEEIKNMLVSLKDKK